MTPQSDTGFPCTGCGACCRIAGLWGHPSADGLSCIFLVRRLGMNGEAFDGCAIYETRPAVCRFGTKKPPGQSMASYAREIADGCNLLQQLEGLPESFRVRLP